MYKFCVWLTVAPYSIAPYKRMMERLHISQPFVVKCLLLLLLAGSVAPLSVALVSQFIFGLFPCDMCIVQRYPYVLAALLVVPVFLYRGNPVWLRRFVWLAVLLWLTEAAAAFYHVGIEQAWWDSATGCTAQGTAGDSLDDLKAAILGSPLVSCADAGAKFIGLSMAAWNSLYALSLMSAGLLMLRKTQ